MIHSNICHQRRLVVEAEGVISSQGIYYEAITEKKTSLECLKFRFNSYTCLLKNYQA